MKRTRLQFGEGPEVTPPPAAATGAAGDAEASAKERAESARADAEAIDLASEDTETAQRCAACGTRLSSDARFCPFDGEPLEDAPLDDHPDPLVGTRVDERYVVGNLLGEGGMGRVYEVRHSALERRFAMKVLREELASEGELAARFTREARAAAAIDHPNVVQITDFGTLPSGQPYFVMELLEGRSLSSIIRRSPLSTRRVLELSAQVARGLHAAHVAGIVHRDLKPDNVVVRAGPRGDDVKVVDFGLAKVAGQSRLTKGGMVFGTPHYMSPEQAMGGEVDARTDQYALGVIMYEAVTGAVPFEADTYMGVMTQHVYAPPKPPRELSGVADIGSDVEAAILRCLAKQPEERFASMDALADELASLLPLSDRRLEPSVPAAPGATPTPRRGPRVSASPPRASAVGGRPALLAVSVVLAAAAALVLGWLLADPPRRVGAAPTASEPGTTVPQGSISAPVATAMTAAPSELPTAAEAPSPSRPPAPAPQAGARAPRISGAETAGARLTGRAPVPAPKPPARPARPEPRFRGTEIVDPWSK